MTADAPQVPTGVVPSLGGAPLSLPVGALKSDAPSLLDEWGVADERRLREAWAHVEQAQTRRNMALQAVDEALSRAGVSPDLRDALIGSATDIRNALAPFDVKAQS